MVRHQGPRPRCVMCGEPGVHPSAEACLEALRGARDALIESRALIGRRVVGRDRKTIIGFKKPRNPA